MSVYRSDRLSDFRKWYPPDLAKSRSESGFRENEPEYRIIDGTSHVGTFGGLSIATMLIFIG